MPSLRVTTVGNSAGVVLPKEVLEKLRVSKGDILYLVEEVDIQLRTERSCDLAQLEVDLVSQGRAAVGASESEYPQVAADVTPGLQAIEDLIPEILTALGCDHKSPVWLKR